MLSTEEVGRLFLDVVERSEVVLVHRHRLPPGWKGDDSAVVVSVSTVDAGGVRHECPLADTVGEALQLLAGGGSGAYRNCGSLAHEGERCLPLCHFSTGDRYCRACRARLAVERRRRKKDGRTTTLQRKQGFTFTLPKDIEEQGLRGEEVSLAAAPDAPAAAAPPSGPARIEN